MEENLKTIQLEYEKSSFLIDLVKHNSGNLYVAVEQIIYLNKNTSESQKIKINPSVLSDIIEVLSDFQKDIAVDKPSNSKNKISDENGKQIIKRYLKGLEIKDLALQFNCSVKVIEQFLRNNKIEIVENKIKRSNRK